MNTSMIPICIWLICRLCTALHTKCCGAVIAYIFCFVFDKTVANDLLLIYTLIHIQNYTVKIIKTMALMPAIEYIELNSLFLNIFNEYAKLQNYEYVSPQWMT